MTTERCNDNVRLLPVWLCTYSRHRKRLASISVYSVSALAALVEWQERHPACKKSLAPPIPKSLWKTYRPNLE